MRMSVCRHGYIRVCPVCDEQDWDATPVEHRISVKTFEEDLQLMQEAIAKAERYRMQNEETGFVP